MNDFSLMCHKAKIFFNLVEHRSFLKTREKHTLSSFALLSHLKKRTRCILPKQMSLKTLKFSLKAFSRSCDLLFIICSYSFHRKYLGTMKKQRYCCSNSKSQEHFCVLVHKSERRSSSSASSFRWSTIFRLSCLSELSEKASSVCLKVRQKCERK